MQLRSPPYVVSSPFFTSLSQAMAPPAPRPRKLAANPFSTLPSLLRFPSRRLPGPAGHSCWSRSIGLTGTGAAISLPMLATLSLMAPTTVVVALPIELLHLLRLRVWYRGRSVKVSPPLSLGSSMSVVALRMLHLCCRELRFRLLKSAPVLMMPLLRLTREDRE